MRKIINLFICTIPENIIPKFPVRLNHITINIEFLPGVIIKNFP